MTTLRQVEANRRNAQHSSGPKTDEGKARSRNNALKHGLAGAGVVVPDAVADEVRRRMEEWNDSIRPFDAFAMYLFEQLCLESVRMDAGNRDLDELRSRQAERASTDWDEPRRLAAEELAAGLSRAPGLVVRQLRRTSQGCDLLIARWASLIAILEVGGGWYAVPHRLAHDLLGTPAELRTYGNPLGEPGEGHRDARLALARGQVEELSRRRDGLRETEVAERAAAERGVGLEETREQARTRRYLASSRRRFEWSLAQLRRDRGAPRPVPRPSPEPGPAPVEPRPAAPPTTVGPRPSTRTTLTEECLALTGLPVRTRLTSALRQRARA